MNQPIGIDEICERFSGRAPIFPLPNVVTFPHVVLPLHIFEQRYRDMVADSLDGEGLIAMALLKPGWEPNYESKTVSIHDTVCLGKIVAQEKLADGRYNLALKGIARACVLAEEEGPTKYRIGKLGLQLDQFPSDSVIDYESRHRELISGFREMYPDVDIDSLVYQLFDSDIPLGALCDILASAMQLDPDIAQTVLAETDVELRSEVILEQLRAKSHRYRPQPIRDFPPPFSRN